MRDRYCVLFTQTLKQWEVTEAMRTALPEGRGTAFYPCVELWIRSLDKYVIEPLFPGYVFVRSDMSLTELHDIIRRRRRDILSFVKELHLSEARAAGETDLITADEDELIDLNDEEAKLLDFILGSGNEDIASLPQDIKSAEKTGKGREYPKAGGALKMSKGYREGGGFVVMEGPLKGCESYIADVNPRERRAYLKLKIGDKRARVGFELKGKKYWYPKDKDATDILPDGTEVNCGDIAKRMTGFGV